jgi:hypothetical protein
MATVGVVAVGTFDVTLLCVVGGLRASRPKVDVLGEVAVQAGFHSTTHSPQAGIDPDLMLFRFKGSSAPPASIETWEGRRWTRGLGCTGSCSTCCR